jgi:hypothetical protein
MRGIANTGHSRGMHAISMRFSWQKWLTKRMDIA